MGGDICIYDVSICQVIVDKFMTHYHTYFRGEVTMIHHLS